jgi:hypothetical protein
MQYTIYIYPEKFEDRKENIKDVINLEIQFA